MGRRVRFSSCWSRPFAFVLVPLILLAATSSATVSAAGSRNSPAAAPACETVLARVPEVNSSLFLEVCSEPSFATALQSWGVGNFTYGWGGGGSFNLFWQFAWVATCTNSTWAGSDCSYQEYWMGNTSNGTVAGPFIYQSIVVCACAVILAHPPPPGSPPTLLPLIALSVGVAVGAAVALWRARRLPPRAQTR